MIGEGYRLGWVHWVGHDAAGQAIVGVTSGFLLRLG